ncbi:MAG: zf-TFIIB domain-containing protein [Acidobacteriota bacterium]|nr:zf-TFIIB domain-containing protein [Acidobacteriota bacterium]
MTCPRCHAEFETRADVCPECGLKLLRNVSGVMKTSAVMIAAAGERGFYRSVQEVPEPLRTQLIETTSSPNSGTIVIADRAGKDQISSVAGRRGKRTQAEPPPVSRLHRVWLFLAGAFLISGAGALIWFVFEVR